MSSSSTAELPAPGDIVAGRYRVERLLPSRPGATRFRASQVTLGRDIDLAFPDEADPDARRRCGAFQARLEHRSILAVLDAGDSTFGYYVATRAVDGVPLSAAAPSLGLWRTLDVLEDVAAAIDAAHEGGLTHGAIDADAIIVEMHGPRASLVGFGPIDSPGGVAADRDALVELLRASLPTPAREAAVAAANAQGSTVPAVAVIEAARAAVPGERPVVAREQRSRKPLMLTGAITAVVAAGIFLLVPRDEAAPAQPPPPVAGATLVGSLLQGSGAVRTVGCDGLPRSVNSPTCTIAQMSLGGRPLEVRERGRLVAWTTRGVRGAVGIQVYRRSGNRWVATVAGQFVAGDHRHEADLPVEPGDRFGLQVAPGSGVGVVGRTGARTGTWTDPLRGRPRPAAAGPTGELQLRVEIVKGTVPVPASNRISGRAARDAPAGTELDAVYFETASDTSGRVAIVRAGGRVFADLFVGDERLVRLDLPDADPRGRLVSLHSTRTEGEAKLRWANPGQELPLTIVLQKRGSTVTRELAYGTDGG